MVQALTLLIMALQLLTAVNHPNVPESLKQSAISTANFAIKVANEALKEGTVQSIATTPAPVQIVTPPVLVEDTSPKFGSVVAPEPVISQPIIMPTQPAPIVPAPVVDKSEIVVVSDQQTAFLPCPDCLYPQYNRAYFIFYVEVLNKDGSKVVADVDIQLPADDLFTVAGHTRTPELLSKQPTTLTPNKQHFGPAVFPYYPTSKGSKTLTFTSGNLTKSVTINVQ